jgi:hypothetical protein
MAFLTDFVEVQSVMDLHEEALCWRIVGRGSDDGLGMFLTEDGRLNLLPCRPIALSSLLI